MGHVEAGLRTYDLDSPYPEEFNRQAVGVLAKYNFAPTEQAKQNLLREWFSWCCPSPQRHDVLRCSAQKRRCLRRRSGQVRLAHLPPQAGGAVRRGKDQVPVKGILAGGVQLHRQSVRRSWCAGGGTSAAR